VVFVAFHVQTLYLAVNRPSTEEFFTPASLKFTKDTKKRKTDPVKMWRYFVFWQDPGRSWCGNLGSRQNKKSRHAPLKRSRRNIWKQTSYPSFSQGKSETPVVTGVSPVPPTRRLLQKTGKLIRVILSFSRLGTYGDRQSGSQVRSEAPVVTGVSPVLRKECRRHGGYYRRQGNSSGSSCPFPDFASLSRAVFPSSGNVFNFFFLVPAMPG